MEKEKILPLKAVIVEDEKKSRETLTGLIHLFCKNVEVAGEADSVATGIAAIRKHLPDIVFLDIQLPDGSGFQLLEKIRDLDFRLIFTTAYDQYAIKAIKYSALDYLLKPIFPEDLVSAVKKAEEKIHEETTRKRIDTLLDNVHQEREPQKLVISTFDEIYIADIDEIIRCESDNYYTLFFFTNGKKMLVSKTLKEYEEILSGHNFIRPHKSHLINLRYVKSYVKSDNRYILMTDGSQIPTSRRKREKILEILGNL